MADSRTVALSVRQPWAQLLVTGRKRVETRSWGTAYRGRVLIHAGRTLPGPRGVANAQPLGLAWTVATLKAFTGRRGQFVCVDMCNGGGYINGHLGRIVGEAVLVDVVQFADPTPLALAALDSSLERSLGDWTPGRYGWVFADPVAYDEQEWMWQPGRLGLFTPALGGDA